MNPDANAIYRRFIGKAKIRHLNLLIQLHDLGNMKRAAEALGLSQPAVSLAVSELEKLLGVQLFLRHARGVEPTPVAADLIPIARRIMAAMGDGVEVVSNAINENSGYIRISATPAAISGILHRHIGSFARKFQSTHIEITEVAGANPLEAISNEVCDILMLREPMMVPESWEFIKVLDDDLIVVCGSQNLLSQQRNISRDDFRNHEWLLTRRGSIARNAFEELAEEAQIPSVNRCGLVMHVPVLTLKLLVQGNYLSLIPRSVAIPWINEGLVVELDSPATKRLMPLGLLWNPTTANRVVRKFVEGIRKI
jgi:DNA-binding transcriptional LysR family regulator